MAKKRGKKRETASTVFEGGEKEKSAVPSPSVGGGGKG